MDTQKCSKCPAKASVQCACQIRQIPLCTTCVGNHLALDFGNHSITMLPNGLIQPENDVCDNCGWESAESVCSCLQPLQKYCVNCKLLHIHKSPHLTHSLLPIQVLKKPFSVSEFAKINEMVRKTNTAKEKLMSNFTLIEVCRDEILRKSNQFIEEIQMWKTETLSEIDLIRYKAEQYIGNICSELEKSKFDLNFVSEIGLVNLIRNGAEMLVERNLVFYQYQCSIDSLKPILSNSISMTFTEESINPSSEIGFLLLIKADSLVKFQLPSCARTELKIADTEATNSTALIFKDSETLFGVGGNDSNSVFSLGVSSNTVYTNYPKMNATRAYPGVIFVDNVLLVFGGLNIRDSLRSCERMELHGSTWTSFGNMDSARSGFNPVQRNSLIYLLGGYQSNGSVETYHFGNSTFQVLQCRLSCESFTCSFAANDEIIVIHEIGICVISPGNVLTFISKLRKKMHRWSSIYPIHHKNAVYYVRSDGSGVHELLCWSIPNRNSEKILDFDK